MSKISKKIKSIIKLIMSVFLTKNKKIIIFESADLFFDNSYYLYLYIKKHFHNYRLFYICRTSKQFSYRKNKKIPRKDILKIYKSKIIIVSVIRNVWKEVVLKNCSFAFCSYLVDDFKALNNIKDNRKVIMLWHGRIGFKSGKEIFKYHFPNKNNYYYCFSTEFSKSILLKDSPALYNTNHVICGNPRNDCILKPDSDKLSKLLGISDISKSHLILVCCTFRKYQSTSKDFFRDEFPLLLNDNQLTFLNRELKKRNTVLLIKTHHAQRYISFNNNQSQFSNIKIRSINDFEKINLSIYETFKLSEALITDYSSIFFDYLLVNKPIAILECDIEKYKKENKILNLKDCKLPNVPVLRSFSDLIDFVICHKDTNEILNEKIKLSSKINGDYLSNCQSVCDAFSITSK